MRLYGVTARGERRLLSPLLSLRLTYGEDRPAGSLRVVLPVLEKPPALRELLLTGEGGKTRFIGVVEEQVWSEEEGGRLLTLSARTLAAYLTDNEALPRVYQNPRLPLLYQEHAAPYGLRGLIGNGQAFGGEYTVSKGMSEWDALAGFCLRYLGVTPQVTPQGLFQAGRSGAERPLLLGGGGRPVLARRERLLPAKRYSEVRVRAERSGGYTEVFRDEEAWEAGIRRRVLLNLADGQTPARQARAWLREGREAARRLELTLPGAVLPDVGARVRVLGEEEEYAVCGVDYQSGTNGETALLTLRGWEEEDE